MKLQKDIKNKPRAGLGLTQELDKVLKAMKEAGLPPDVQAGIDLRKKVKEARAAILEEEKRHIAMFEKKDKVANIKNYPNYEKDLETLRVLYANYGKNKVFGKGSESMAKALMASYPKDQKKYDSIYATYKPFMDVNGAAYNKGYKQKENLSRNFRSARQALAKFSTAQKEYLEGAQAEIESYMKKASDMLNEAVTTKKPAWITGGVAQNVTHAGTFLSTYSGVMGADNPKVKKLQVKYDALTAKVDKARVDLREEIIAAQKVPPNAFSGSDKGQIIKLAEAEWKSKHPNKKILKSGIAMRNWDRRTEWRWSSGRQYKVDYSKLQVWIIVKTDARLATQYIVGVSKDHMKGDQVNYYAPKDLAGRGAFRTEMLLKNVK